MRILSPLSRDWSLPRNTLPSFLVDSVYQDFDRIVDNLIEPTLMENVGLTPPFEIEETDEHYLVSVDVPGVKKEDIKIEVNGNSLSIMGERYSKTKNAKKETSRVYGKFVRTFEIPNFVSADKIEAQYDNGVLNIAIPKDEQVKGRKIEIKTGEAGFFSKFLGSKNESAKELKDVKES